MLKATATIKQTAGGITVETVWIGEKLDRPSVDGFDLQANHLSLAIRLKNAIEAGAVYSSPKILKDVDGKTYVEASCHVLGRRMNADLRRLGF